MGSCPEESGARVGISEWQYDIHFSSTILNWGQQSFRWKLTGENYTIQTTYELHVNGRVRVRDPTLVYLRVTGLGKNTLMNQWTSRQTLTMIRLWR